MATEGFRREHHNDVAIGRQFGDQLNHRKTPELRREERILAFHMRTARPGRSFYLYRVDTTLIKMITYPHEHRAPGDADRFREAKVW